MSLSPSFPQGAPTLAEVLLQRTFAKPPTPFVDGELTKALATATIETPPATVAIQASAESGASQDSPSGGSGATSTDDASTPSSDGAATGRNVDVRV